MCVCEWVDWQPWMASLRAVSTIKTIKYEWRHVAEICFAKCRKTLAYQITTELTNSKHKHAMRPYSHSLPSPLQVELRRLRQESNLFAICTWLTGAIAVLLAHCLAVSFSLILTLLPALFPSISHSLAHFRRPLRSLLKHARSRRW